MKSPFWNGYYLSNDYMAITLHFLRISIFYYHWNNICILYLIWSNYYKISALCKIRRLASKPCHKKSCKLSSLDESCTDNNMTSITCNKSVHSVNFPQWGNRVELQKRASRWTFEVLPNILSKILETSQTNALCLKNWKYFTTKNKIFYFTK